MGSHLGTHLDAPRHFIKNGRTVEQIPLSTLVGKSLLLNFSKLNNSTEISKELLKKKIFEIVKTEEIPKILTLRFDWTDKYYKTKKFYTKHPFLSSEACEWLVKKKINTLAMDTPQPDNPKNCMGTINDAINHKILLKKNITIVEYLTNLKKIKSNIFTIVISPLKIKGLDGCPIRCFAIV